MAPLKIWVLTLKKHEDGVWIRRLVRELNEIIRVTNQTLTTTTLSPSASSPPSSSQPPTAAIPDGGVQVDVVALETWMARGLPVSTTSGMFGNSKIVGIVNRVSDAATPALFKACCAVLSSAQLQGIPVFNGVQSYTLCANKWCQHVLFRQAQLQAPPTLAFWQHSSHDDQPSAQLSSQLVTQVFGDTKNSNDAEDAKPPLASSYLIKPNAGGFGAGITRLDHLPEAATMTNVFDDHVSLMQQYVPPRNQKLYRVWFLQGHVHCAVERTLDDDNNNTNEFTGACAASSGGACAVTPGTSARLLEAYRVPAEVQRELEDQLLPLLPDAHCGSVEYLYNADGTQRLYFDLNLLSTLPLKLSDPHRILDDDFNPWRDLARAVWDHCGLTNTNSKNQTDS